MTDDLTAKAAELEHRPPTLFGFPVTLNIAVKPDDVLVIAGGLRFTAAGGVEVDLDRVAAIVTAHKLRDVDA